MSEQAAAPDFDSIKQVNPYGTEYWSARSLMELLGYEKWENFNTAIRRAMTSCEQTDNKVDDHFPESRKMVMLGSGAVRDVKDYTLSRFACYLIAQNGEPSKPEIAAAQVYFAISTRAKELKDLAEEQNERVTMRERVTEHTKALNDTARNAGVLSANFGKFHNAGYQAMYGGLDVGQIKARKRIDQKEDLLDRAGRAELAANLFRITQTEQKISNEGIIGQQAAINAHAEVGNVVRKAIKETGGTLPENLPAEPSVKPLIEAKRRGKRKAIQPKEQGSLLDFNTHQND